MLHHFQVVQWLQCRQSLQIVEEGQLWFLHRVTSKGLNLHTSCDSLTSLNHYAVIECVTDTQSSLNSLFAHYLPQFAIAYWPLLRKC